jgi:hypothetical protein
MNLIAHVTDAFLQAITPAAIQATRLSVEQLQANHDAALSQWRLGVERARYEAQRAERRYRGASTPKTAGWLAAWKPNGRRVCATLLLPSWNYGDESSNAPARSVPNSSRLLRASAPIFKVWNAPTITDRDRKELLRTLLEEVILNLKRAEGRAHLTLRWRGGAFTALDVPVPPSVSRAGRSPTPLRRATPAGGALALLPRHGHRCQQFRSGALRGQSNVPTECRW